MAHSEWKVVVAAKRKVVANIRIIPQEKPKMGCPLVTKRAPLRYRYEGGKTLLLGLRLL